MTENIPTGFERFYTRPTDHDVETAISNATVVFDTNVFNNMYRFTRSSREAYVKLFVSVKDRLFVPHQVVTELYRSRVGAISGRAHDIAQREKDIDEAKSGLLETFRRLHERLGIPQADHSEFTNTINAVIREEIDRLKLGLDELGPAVRPEDDYILGSILDVIDGRIGPQFSDSDWDKHVNEGNRRVGRNEAPGFKDKSKKNLKPIDVSDTMQLRELAAGDYLIWRQMIDYAKNSNSDIVFVSDDKKEDWWHFQNKQPVHGRMELLLEFEAESGCKITFVDSTQFAQSFPDLDDEARDRIYDAARSAAVHYFPTISRRASYAHLSGEDLEAVDLRYWIVGAQVRDQSNPLIIAEGGRVVRAWGVKQWIKRGNKWEAISTGQLTNQDLEDVDSPLLIGDTLDTRIGGAYFPVTVDELGNIWRANELLKPEAECRYCELPIPRTDGGEYGSYNYGYIGFCNDDCYDRADLDRVLSKED
ncbi:PIN-like domain-containing protein [Nocardia sp. NPDC058658]|uniref:PIN-like domain-containing protein n=1 Tax=Nocardia sp. NPDC058658 TaxID=3346580 RepID=UPI00365CFE53